MTEYLQLAYKTFMQFSKEAPFVAGFLTVWITGVVTFLLRSVPQRIHLFARNRLTSQLSLTNSGWGENELNFHSFLTWYLSQPLASWSRTYSLERMYLSGAGHTDMVGAGAGTHYFIFKGRLFWFTRKRIEGAGSSDKIKEEVCITGLTRSKRLVLDLIAEFKYKANDNSLFAYKWEGKEYGSRVRLMERAIKTVVLSGDNMTRMIAEIQDFIDNRKWYEDRGIPYKLVILLLGPPGTGKTSCVRSLATHFKRNVYQVNINSLTDNTAFKAFSEPRKDSIILVEEIDDNDTVKARAGIAEAIAKQTGGDCPITPPVDIVLKPVGETVCVDIPVALTLTSLLNALDGVVPLDGALVIMTSNDISKIDPALLRSGRIDTHYTLEYLGDKEIREYVRVMTDEPCMTTAQFKSISGSDLYDLFRKNKHSVSDFIASIPCH